MQNKTKDSISFSTKKVQTNSPPSDLPITPALLFILASASLTAILNVSLATALHHSAKTEPLTIGGHVKPIH